VFVNGRLGAPEDRVEADDRIEVIPAISGGR
jgi:sulfur carrier protein ThiS